MGTGTDLEEASCVCAIASLKAQVREMSLRSKERELRCLITLLPILHLSGKSRIEKMGGQKCTAN